MCAVVLALTSAGIAHATTRVKVIGTFPAGDAITLGRNQNFHRHLANTSDRPVQIWARPYFAGKAANAGSNASRSYPAGSGEAMDGSSCSIPARGWTKYGSVRVTGRPKGRKSSRPIRCR